MQGAVTCLITLAPIIVRAFQQWRKLVELLQADNVRLVNLPLLQCMSTIVRDNPTNRKSDHDSALSGSDPAEIF